MKHLIVLLGPTGVGKTHASIQLAQTYHAPIVSADSRQIYRGIEIGTAAASKSEQALVPHYIIGTKDLDEPYSAGQYEEDVLNLLHELFKTHDVVFLVGGSMMYIDAVCKGMDDIPSVDNAIREQIKALYTKKGLDGVRELLQSVDPEHYKKVDLQNTQRVLHAVEVSLMTGKPYSSLLTNKIVKREFSIVKIGFNLPREVLYAQINLRVEKMFEQGLVDEAQKLYSLKNLNSLNTVGYKEIFDYIDGIYPSLEIAKDKIKQHSRNYAKRQLTWFKKDENITWFHPNDVDGCIKHINVCLKNG
jgi:tRNA dimethylallyltransferase